METVENLVNLIKKEPNNDYLKPLLAYHTFNLITGKPILTEHGIHLLNNFDLGKIFEKLKTEPNNQRALTSAALYVTICYNVLSLFLGLIETLKTEKYGLDTEIVEFIASLKDETIELIDSYERCLESWQPHILDRYAKLFNQEKSRVFHGNPFKVELRLPSMVPDEAKDAVEVK